MSQEPSTDKRHEDALVELYAKASADHFKDCHGCGGGAHKAGLLAVFASAASHAPRIDGWCPTCKGSGSMKGMTSGLGPDDHEIDVDCKTCGGTGAGTIPSTTPQKRAVALDRKHQAEWNANPGLPIDEAASLSAHHCDAFRMLAHQLEHELGAANRRADARAREACTSEKRTTCSFAASATLLTPHMRRLLEQAMSVMNCSTFTTDRELATLIKEELRREDGGKQT